MHQVGKAETSVSWKVFLKTGCAPALALVCVAVWPHAADEFIVATMLPSIVAEIGGAGLVGWTVSLYEIASLVAGAASALLTMRYGLLAPMSLAGTTFAFGCFLIAFAPTMLVLLAGRLFQGLGAGGLASVGFVAIGVMFPQRFTARALAAVSIFWGVSAFIGPLIGSFFVEFASWRWGFASFGLLGIVLAIWVSRRPDVSRPQKYSSVRLPWERLALLFFAVLLVSYGGVKVTPIQSSICILFGLACLLMFFRLDTSAEDNRMLPDLPLDPRKPTGSALLMILSLSIATIAMTAFGPLLISAIHDVSALAIGYIVACSSIGWTLMAVLVSGTPERWDRIVIATGMGLVTASTAALFFVVPFGPVWLIAVCAAIEGAGFGMAWTFTLRRTTALSTLEETQRISAAIPTMQRLGYALGAAYIGIVANATGFASMETAAQATRVAQWIFGACLPFAVFGLLAMITLVRKE